MFARMFNKKPRKFACIDCNLTGLNFLATFGYKEVSEAEKAEKG